MMSLPTSNLGNAGALDKPPANVYTVMMVLSLVALVVGCIFLFAEMKIYDLDIKAQSAKFNPPPMIPPATPPTPEPTPEPMPDAAQPMPVTPDNPATPDNNAAPPSEPAAPAPEAPPAAQ
jgi:hypothetical protein